jgi:hypothetical protein
MDCYSGRLIENEKILVLVENLQRNVLRFQVYSLWARLAELNPVSSPHRLPGPDKFAIQPDVPGLNQQLNPASRQAIDFGCKKDV